MNLQALSELIKNRRAVYPKNYLEDRAIDRALIEQLLENAIWAPTHRLTQPWRFRVFHSETSRKALGEWLLAANEKRSEEPIPPEKQKKILENPQRAGCAIAIVCCPDERQPEWEEQAAVACAVQNLWLSAAAAGLGAYWSSPSVVLGREAADFLQLEEAEFCMGLFYMGWPEGPVAPGRRDPLSEKTLWF